MFDILRWSVISFQFLITKDNLNHSVICKLSNLHVLLLNAKYILYNSKKSKNQIQQRNWLCEYYSCLPDVCDLQLQFGVSFSAASNKLVSHYGQPSVVVKGPFSFDNDRKTNAIKMFHHISRILLWLIWLITILNQSAWSFFLTLRDPNWVSMCRTITMRKWHGN